MEFAPALRRALLAFEKRTAVQRSRSRCALLHNSAFCSANPIPFPTTAEPPPPPPEPAAVVPDDRIDRKRKQAELLQKGRELRAIPSRPATVLQKRFWKEVSVNETPDGLQILLDKRPVRTQQKNVLTIPANKHQLATALALEWDQLVNAQQALKQHYVPLTSLTSRAIDIRAADAQGNTKIRDDVVRMVMRYLNTDTLLCWASENGIHDKLRNEAGETLREVQARVAQPIIGHLTTYVWPGVEISPVLAADSILPAPQPVMTQEVIRGWISGLPAWELAGLERAVLASKSLLVAVRLLVEWSQEFSSQQGEQEEESRFGIEDAADACTMEVRWQTDMWGEVEDTHDVDREDIRRQLGSVVLLVNGESR